MPWADMAAYALTSLATLGRMLDLPVDRDSAVPPYRQVAAALIAAIRSGEYQPGDRLPAILDLVHASGIARLTASKALRLVADKGYAELSPGMGYYVTGRLPGGTRAAHDSDTP